MPHRLLGYLTLFTSAIFLSFSVSYVYLTKIRPWTTVTAYADDIGNLKIDNPVQISGVKVGRVKSVSRENGKARVALILRKTVAIKDDYRLVNIDVGLMGDRALALFPGDSGARNPNLPLEIEFAPGIAEGMSHADSLKTLLTQLKDTFALVARVNPANDSLFITRFNKVVHTIDVATAALEKTVVLHEPALTSQVHQLLNMGRKVNRVYRETAPVTQKAIRWSAKTSEELLTLLDKVEPLAADLDKLSIALSRNDGWLMSLADDGEKYRKLLESVEKLRQVLLTLQSKGVGIDIDLF